MAEYIGRVDAIKAVKEQNAFTMTRAALIDVLNGIPAADVAPLVHGRWENGNPICPVCGEDKFKDLDADIWADWQPPYCPNCGAKMDGGADNEM